MIPHDQWYKRGLANKVVVWHLLRGYVRHKVKGGKEWIDRFEFASLERVATEQVDQDLRSIINDMVWRVRFRDADGQQRWLHVLLMFEFQSEIDWFMALRVQRYAVQLYDSEWRDRKARRKDRLPPILPVVIYNGETPWRAATRMADLVGEGAVPHGARPSADPSFTGDSYVLIDMKAYKGKALPSDNAFSLMVQAELMEDEADVSKVLTEALPVLRKPDRAGLRETFPVWFGRLIADRMGITLEFMEDWKMLDRMEQTGELRTTLKERFQARYAAIRTEGLREGLQEGHRKGIREGLQEGHRKGIREEREQSLERQRRGLRRLARKKFGEETASRLAARLVATRSADRLEDVGEWIIECEDSDALLARVQDLA